MSACIVYTGSRTSRSGYGQMWKGGRVRLAHRAAWEEAYGPIPAGMIIMHTCDNPPCVNLEHLRLGTQADNMADKVAKGRQARGSMCRRSDLTDDVVATIRETYATGSVTQADLARRFGVTRPTISHIVTGRTWKHLVGQR